MPYTFPSDDWVAELKVQINSDQEYAEAARTWEGDFNFYVEGIPGVDKTPVIYLDLWHGQCRSAHFSNADSAQPAAFKVSGPLANWKRVITKQIGPIPALVSGQLKVHGNLTLILRYVRATQQLVECATRVDTEFPN